MTKIEKIYYQIRAKIEKIEDPHSREVARLALRLAIYSLIPSFIALVIAFPIIFLSRRGLLRCAVVVVSSIIAWGIWRAVRRK